MLLAMDIGNTNVVFGVHDGEVWRHHWRVRTVRDKMADEYGVLLRSLLREAELTMAAFDRIVIASVVPPLTGRMEEMLSEQTPVPPLVISHRVDTGLSFAVENPREVGADLIADAVAAYARVQGACIVVDFGTATTFTAVSADAVFLGVAIAPGMNLAASALAGGTAQLPQVRLSPPDRAIGTNTVHAVQSGVLLGYCGLVEGMIDRFEAEILGEARVVATGGLSGIIAPLTRRFSIVDEWLTLEGIRLIGERNVSPA
ncbi:MAG: type III pantothenate kinase [Anaerolineae bacterium]|nr:type III pantothenate kinase [Anaerolineae bacterium]